MALVRWNPWSDLFALHDQMDQLFGQAFEQPSTSQRGSVATLPVDIRQTDDAFVLEASVPGFRPEDVEVTLDGSVLTIQGTLRRETEDREHGYVRRERRASSVYRQVNLPAEVRADQIAARFENGVLTITVPRAQRGQPRRIEVSAAGSDTGKTQVIDAPATTAAS